MKIITRMGHKAIVTQNMESEGPNATRAQPINSARAMVAYGTTSAKFYRRQGDDGTRKYQTLKWSITNKQQFTDLKHGKCDISKWQKFGICYDPVVAGTRDGSGDFVNDRAILRACQATFRPPSLKSDPKKTVFVGRLQLSVTEKDVQQLFEKCGKIRHMRLVHDMVTGASRGYAFVTFKHSSAVREALRLHGTVIGGRPILVEHEVGRNMPGWKPRRLGGGFGGRKESGQMRFGGRACPHQGEPPTSMAGGSAAAMGHRADLSSRSRSDRDRSSGGRERSRTNKERRRSRSQERRRITRRSRSPQPRRSSEVVEKEKSSGRHY
ncbi:U11/U12 small nuclear ribonucleoprotein 35 kDa protein-like [Tropilaelaps mercedesae]|uniref:U11/U12 small nuclear ribonucleoprotein 35 kDa protein n=1 Tax=Tropilaelaps mercedesae TaxID=418985 RepID=A0A1V9XV05_9ACAR|nr:U11/U12 small nuclear ribonucleoprotein 35 kDa protein-like [Tropilaelaps mercedesae]